MDLWALPWRRAVAVVIGLGAALGAAANAQPPDAAAPLQLSYSLGESGDPSAPAALGEPVPGAPISSPFGWRVHPILKVRRFHNGVDYAAPIGTPVHAAADGVIEMMGRVRHFGRVVRLRHADAVETAYSHLARFTRGLAVGAAVHAGEVIGVVGRSGWATGPHLDYEVIVAGRNVNPAGREPNPPLHLLPAERLLLPAPTVASLDAAPGALGGAP